jgi:hypothetical protein
VNSSEPLYYFDGQPSTYAQATRDIGAIQAKLRSDVRAAGRLPNPLQLLHPAEPAAGPDVDRLPRAHVGGHGGACEVVSLIYEYDDGLRKRPRCSTV